jgi:uncharacterized protein (TIGR00369 family)
MSKDTQSRTYTYDTRRMKLQDLATQSGLEYLKKVFAGEIAGSPIASTLDFHPVELEAGRVVFEGEPKQFVFNPIGSVHGGYGAALLDTVLGCSIQTMLEAGQSYTTVELKVNYVRAMTDQTGFVRAEGKVIHVGKSLATAEAKLYGRDDGKLYAHGSTTCFVFPLPPSQNEL